MLKSRNPKFNQIHRQKMGPGKKFCNPPINSWLIHNHTVSTSRNTKCDMFLKLTARHPMSL